jgi:hypothetical protein
LDVRDDPPRIGLVPAPVTLLGGEAELRNQVAEAMMKKAESPIPTISDFRASDGLLSKHKPNDFVHVKCRFGSHLHRAAVADITEAPRRIACRWIGYIA